MKRTVFRKMTTLAVALGATLLYGCGQNQVTPYGTGQFAAGCASIAGPISFFSHNATYTSTNLYAQGMQVGTGAAGIIPATAGAPVANGYGLPTLTVQKIAGDGSQLSLSAQSMSAGVNPQYPQYQPVSGGATLNGSITLSPAVQQIINTRYGNYGYSQQYPTQYPNQYPTQYPTTGYNTQICVQSASLQAVVNPGGASPDARWLQGWVQLTFSSGGTMTMSF